MVVKKCILDIDIINCVSGVVARKFLNYLAKIKNFCSEVKVFGLLFLKLYFLHEIWMFHVMEWYVARPMIGVAVMLPMWPPLSLTAFSI